MASTRARARKHSARRGQSRRARPCGSGASTRGRFGRDSASCPHGCCKATASRALRALAVPPRVAGSRGRGGSSCRPPGPPATAHAESRDPVVQSRPGPSGRAVALQFDGAATNDNIPFSGLEVIPPEANGAAGPNHYFQAINLVFVTSTSPAGSRRVRCAVGGPRRHLLDRRGRHAPDQVRHAGRGVSQVAFDVDDGSTHQCVAVSTSGDPADTYAQYDFVIDNAGLSPHPIATTCRFGIWPEAYYMTVLLGFGLRRVRHLRLRPAATAGGDAGGVVRVRRTRRRASADPLGLAMPSDLDGANPPPTARPTSRWRSARSSSMAARTTSCTCLIMLTSSIRETPPPSDGPVDVRLAAFDGLSCGNANLGEGCVPQSGSGQLIQAEPHVLMYRLAYRNFGDHESLVTNFTVDGAGGARGRRDPLVRATRSQRRALGVSGRHLRAGRELSLHRLDRDGPVRNMALGYSKSDDTIHPSLAVTGRRRPSAGSAARVRGAHSLPPVVGFWGNYSSMAVDPSDDCTLPLFTAEQHRRPRAVLRAQLDRIVQVRELHARPLGRAAGATSRRRTAAIRSPARKAHGGRVGDADDAAGHYQFLTLPVGAYDMTVSKFA